MFERPTITACAPLVSMPVADQHLLHAVRRARDGTPSGRRSPACPRSPDGSRPRPWRGRSGLSTCLAVDVLRQRQLDQDAMDRGVGVQPVHRSPAARPRWSSPEPRGLTECIPASSQAFPLLPHVDLCWRDPLRPARPPDPASRPSPRAAQPRRRLRHGSPCAIATPSRIARAHRAIAHGARLPDHHHLDLAGILQFVLDPPGDRLRQQHRRRRRRSVRASRSPESRGRPE